MVSVEEDVEEGVEEGVKEGVKECVKEGVKECVDTSREECLVETYSFMSLRDRNPLSINVAAARPLRRMSVFLTLQTATWSGERRHRMVSILTDWWKEAAASAAPFSFAILSLIFLTAVLISGPSASVMLLARISSVIFLYGTGSGPAPAR